MKAVQFIVFFITIFMTFSSQAAAGDKGLLRLPTSNNFQKHMRISERALPLATAFKLLGAGCVVSAQFLPTEYKAHKALMGSAAFIMAVADPLARSIATYELGQTK